ncbi:MAG: lysophospholipid acyltransferase family protein [Bacteroidota bacterium]
MRIQHILEYLVFEMASMIVQSMPLKAVQKVGSALGVFVFTVLRFRRSVTLDNLKKAFPEYNGEQIGAIAREAFRNVGISLLELLWFPRLSAAKVNQIVKVENIELLTVAKARGKGALILTAHFGNWELVPMAVLTAITIPLTLVVKTQSNKLIDKKITERRTRLGSRIVPMEFAVREVLRTLQRGDVVVIAADQAAARESITVNFFGRLVPTFAGPAVFSLKTGAPILMGLVTRQEDGTYSLRFAEVPRDDLKEYSEDAVAELTRRHVAMAESMIRIHPGQWLWMHRRWKHSDHLETKATEHPNREHSL